MTPPNNNKNLMRLLAAFSQFSLTTQSKVKTLINSPPSSVVLPPTIPRILFSSSSEQPISGSSSDFGLGTHPFIIQLAQNAIHIPLVLFTSKLTNKLHKESTSIKQNTVYNSLGTKCHVMDLSQFPEESTMDIADWHEAWNCYRVFLESSCDHTLYTRWNDHYQFLAKQDDFRNNFPAILKFDIEERTRYSLDPREFNRESYLCHFKSVKIEVMHTKIRNATQNLGVKHTSST
ncbi:hypothetical protein BDZ94DRAFT_1178185 [Collybia nuda]|uniref:Uncharacterized protein n=1 Tax=Collybia nuda TaxID=64659 RepID=A0A9P6C8Q2_9AGAR|nr:hypothetical protein BDZ94DRAFT_1178185 [Collybia nuda]